MFEPCVEIYHKADQLYRQCSLSKLSNGHTYFQVSYIPAKFAVKNAVLALKLLLLHLHQVTNRSIRHLPPML